MACWANVDTSFHKKIAFAESASLGCNSTTELDCFGDGTMCLGMDKVCDGANDCGAWQDEPKGRRKTGHK